MRIAPILALVALAAQGTAAPEPRPIFVTPVAKAAAQAIQAEKLRGHIRFLASDLLEGRGPATRGDRLAQAYIAAQMESLGSSRRLRVVAGSNLSTWWESRATTRTRSRSLGVPSRWH